MGLRHRVGGFGGAKAEAAVFCLGHGFDMPIAVQVFPSGFRGPGLLLKAAGAVVEDVHVPVVAVVAEGIVGVDPPAPQTHGFAPVVPGVDAAIVGRLVVHVGGVTGGGVAVRVADVPGGVGHTGGGVLRHPVGDAGGVDIGLGDAAVLLDGAVPALHGAIGAGSVLGEGVRSGTALQPVLRRVVIDIFLAGGAGGEGDHPQGQGQGQKQGEKTSWLCVLFHLHCSSFFESGFHGVYGKIQGESRACIGLSSLIDFLP